MSSVGYDRPPLQTAGIYIHYKDDVHVGIGPELGRCPSQRAVSVTIRTRYGIFIPAAVEDTHVMVVYSKLLFTALFPI